MPSSLAYDGKHYLYIGDECRNQIFRQDLNDRTVSVLAGDGHYGFSGDGQPATQARLNRPLYLAAAPDGTVYVADSGNFRIRAIASNGTIQTVVGRDLGDGGPARDACLGWPQGVAIDNAGNVYVSDSEHGRVRRIDATTGRIKTVLAAADLPGGTEELEEAFYPTGLSWGAHDALYVVDTRHQCVWELELTSNRLSRIADPNHQLKTPEDIAAGPDGEVYIADPDKHVIWRAQGTGGLTAFAGTPGREGFAGDDGPAKDALLRHPIAVCCDRAGTVYISDDGNQRLRQVKDGVMRTWAGTGRAGDLEEGADVSRAPLNLLGGVAVAESGMLVVWRRWSACRIEAGPRMARWLVREIGPAGRVHFVRAAAKAGVLVVADQAHNAIHRLKLE
jgi:DNA-binding beta-propeller fold protein YncE